MIGFRLPLLGTSAGRAYLAFCPAAEREAVLDHPRRIDEPQDRPFLPPRRLARMLEDTRRRDLGVRDGGEFRPKTSSIAAPVVVGERVEAVVSMIWIRSALSLEEAIAAHAAMLREVGSAIARAGAVDEAAGGGGAAAAGGG